MESWILGDRRNIYTVVSAALGPDPILSDATYEVFDTADESVVASGAANISNLIVYFLWEPEDTGVYVARIYYNILDEQFTAHQIIEVKEIIV